MAAHLLLIFSMNFLFSYYAQKISLLGYARMEARLGVKGASSDLQLSAS